LKLLPAVSCLIWKRLLQNTIHFYVNKMQTWAWQEFRVVDGLVMLLEMLLELNIHQFSYQHCVTSQPFRDIAIQHHKLAMVSNLMTCWITPLQDTQHRLAKLAV
jgi:hypothetical protein